MQVVEPDGLEMDKEEIPSAATQLPEEFHLVTAALEGLEGIMTVEVQICPADLVVAEEGQGPAILLEEEEEEVIQEVEWDMAVAPLEAGGEVRFSLLNSSCFLFWQVQMMATDMFLSRFC